MQLQHLTAQAVGVAMLRLGALQDCHAEEQDGLYEAGIKMAECTAYLSHLANAQDKAKPAMTDAINDHARGWRLASAALLQASSVSGEFTERQVEAVLESNGNDGWLQAQAEFDRECLPLAEKQAAVIKYLRGAAAATEQASASSQPQR